MTTLGPNRDKLAFVQYIDMTPLLATILTALECVSLLCPKKGESDHPFNNDSSSSGSIEVGERYEPVH